MKVPPADESLPVLAWDTETYRIGPGAVAPKHVCSSFASGDEDHIQRFLVGNGDACFDQMNERLLEPGHLLVGQNIAYDLGVLVTARPDLESKIWAKLARGEVTDIGIQEKLLDLSTHGELGKIPLPDGTRGKTDYAMADMAMHYLHIDLTQDKEASDAVRLRYDEMDGVCAGHYPPDFQRYALDDGGYTLGIYYEQKKRVQTQDGVASCATATFHTMAAYALFLITCRGMETDPEEFRKLVLLLVEETSAKHLQPLITRKLINAATPAMPWKKDVEKVRELMAEHDKTGEPWEHQEWLEEHGIKFKKAAKIKKNVKDGLRPYVQNLCESNNIPLVRNDPTEQFPDGSISLAAEVIEDIAAYDTKGADEDRTPLDCLLGLAEIDKLMTTELPRLMWPKPDKKQPITLDMKPSPIVHFPFNVIVRTTRTSSHASNKYPSANGQNIDPRARPSYRARDGFVLGSTDYSSLELRTTGQVTYDLFGDSEHRNRINSGYDLHAWLGSNLALRLHPEFRGLCERRGISQDRELIYQAFLACKGHSKKAVAAFFKHFRTLAKPVGLGLVGGLGIKTFIAIAKRDYGVNIIELAASMGIEELEINDSLLWHIEHTFGLDPNNWEWTPAIKGFALAIMLKKIWLETYPEMVQYFKAVQTWKDPSHEDKLCYTSPLGMFRAGVDFCAAANGCAMQTPAAEGVKMATIQVVRAFRDPMMGSPLHGNGGTVDMIHDELLNEMREPVAHELVPEIERLMDEAMAEITPDVQPQTPVETALMRNWSKDALDVYSPEGILIPWEPDATYEKQDGRLVLVSA